MPSDSVGQLPTTSAVVVCGSRKWPVDQLYFVTAVMIQHTPRWKIITGGARGVDRHAHMEAVRLGWPRHEEKADWEVKPDTPKKHIRYRRDASAYNVMAGFDRNRRMLDMHPDLVLAFQWGGSSGTQDTIDEARRRGIEVRVFTENDTRPDLAALDSEDEPIYPDMQMVRDDA